MTEITVFERLLNVLLQISCTTYLRICKWGGTVLQCPLTFHGCPPKWRGTVHV